jgi:regulator of protease activity HflC (stomatin/prohibitin superfamily)
MFPLAIIAIIIGLGAIIVAQFLHFTDYRFDPSTGKKEEIEVTGPKRIVRLAGAAVLLLGLIFTGFSSFYSQDPGEATLQRAWTGQLVGAPVTDAGAHFKAPWTDVIAFNIRNQQVQYAGESGNQSDNSGGVAEGAQITVIDADGVKSNVDITITYSLDPTKIVKIYNQYLNEENLRSKLIFKDIRSVTRDPFTKLSTLEATNDRVNTAEKIRKLLEEKWDDVGVFVDDVALQEVRPPQSVVDARAEAQTAEIGVTSEQAKLEQVKVSAQQQVVKAQATADANALLTQSLTPEILQNKYLDSLKEGTVFVVPEGSTPLITTK